MPQWSDNQNQHRNLFIRQATFTGLAARLAGHKRKPAFLAFERFEEGRSFASVILDGSVARSVFRKSGRR